VLARRASAAALSLALGLLAGAAAAHGTGPRPLEGALSELPPGLTKRDLMELKGRMVALGEGARPAEPSFAEAVRALERARNARDAGDAPHARLLDRVGAAWCRVASSLVETVELERAAEEAQRVAKERRAEVARARTLLEGNQERLGRLQAQWEKARATMTTEPAPTEPAKAPPTGRRPTPSRKAAKP